MVLMDCPVFCLCVWLGLPSFGERFDSWLDSSPLKEKGSNIMLVASLSLLWAIWRERNLVTFEDECFSFDRLKSFFLRSLCSWASLITEVDCYLVRYIFSSL